MSDPISRLNAALEGRYRIERKLGEGGMATVYLAEDLKHERKVALKVLKPELAAVVGAERFLAEIKTTANLQHPHILPLHDSGEADGLLFYVMPFVEGESLRARLDREHQLPVDDAVRIATNIAEALDYAHRHGVIHRDIKPANVLLQDGKPVISDFGIALAIGAAGGGRLTETGLSLGTPHYMSPEQATGELHVGPPTDIWALGCVLYEMLVGEPPFTGGTPQAVLGKIITGESDAVSDHRRTVPQNVAAAVSVALEKVPADRFDRAEALALALADSGFRRRTATSTRPAEDAPRWKAIAIASIAIAVAFAGSTAWFARSAQTPPSAPTFSSLTPPGAAVFNPNWGLAISPDGRTIVFVDDNERRIYRRDLDRLDAVVIPGTESPWKPFFAPNGQSIAFFDDTENVLKRVRLDGSELQALAPVPPTGRSGVWTPDGDIVFHSSGLDGGGVFRISADGGEVERVSHVGVSWMHLLPGSHAIVASRRGERTIVAIRLDSGEEVELFPGMTPRYAAGHLVYWRDGAVWAVPFDAENLVTTGSPSILAQDVVGGGNDFALFAISDNLFIYRREQGEPDLRLVWLDRANNEEPLPGLAPGEYRWPRISPDGRRVAFVGAVEGNADIWVRDLDTQISTRLTFNPATDWGPIWSPDGARVVFTSDRDGARNLYSRRADGTDEVTRLTTSETDQRAYGWAPDGSVVYTEGGDIFSVRPEFGAEPLALLDGPHSESHPAFSPDGAFLAYVSDELGYPEVFVRPYPDLRGGWLVSTLDIAPFSGITGSDRRDGRVPMWSKDGSELFYQSGYGLVRIPVDRGAALPFGTPEILYEDFGAGIDPGPDYDVAPDGRVLKQGGSRGNRFGGLARDELVVVQDWVELLAERRD